jgi:TPR repeat protein
VDKTDEERIKELMKRIEAKDAGAMCQLANYYYIGINGLQQDGQKATELWKHAVEIGSSHAHNNLADMFCQGGDLKKAKFHYEAAAMAGHEGARYNLGTMENDSRNLEQAIKHWMIGASAGDYTAMNALRKYFEIGVVTQESIESILTEYNNSCVEMRSKARDTYIRMCIDRKRKALNT